MLDFANPYYLFLLLTVPAVWVIYMIGRALSRRKLRRFGRPEIIRHLMPDVSRYKGALKLTLRLLALVALIVALARPRYGEKEVFVSNRGAEIVIAFDVSNSMLANSTDDPESVSRLERSQMLLERLVGDLKNDKIGLVAFAGTSQTLMPLTYDKHIIQMALQNDLTPNMIKNQGTSISSALERSEMTFPALREAVNQPDGEKKKTEDEPVHRAIILITDAEDHYDDAVEYAKLVAAKGVQIDVIGVGTETGSKIPMEGGKYMTDSDGNDVVTKLNSAAAQEIAEAGGGVYVNASDPNAFATLKDSLDKLKKSEFERTNYKMSDEQFPLFAWIALIFLLLDIFVLERKTVWLKGVNIFTHKMTSLKKTKK